MREVVATYGQTIYDIALKYYGCYEGVFTLMEDNLVDLNTKLIPGQRLKVRNEVPEITANNRVIVDFYNLEIITPNSGFENVDGDFDFADYNGFDFNAI